MKRQPQEDSECNSDHKKKIKPSLPDNNQSYIIYNDIVGSILQFLEWKQVVCTCSLVSKQWYEQCTKVPLSIMIRRGHLCQNIAKCKLLSNLTHFDGTNCFQTDEFIDRNDIQALASSEIMSNLKSLLLFANEIDDECCKLIANSNYLKNITCLTFGECEISAKGVEYLLNSENCKNLSSLKLESLSEVDTTLLPKILSNSKYLDNMTSLELNDGLLDENGISSLNKFTKLRSLSLNLSELINIEPLTSGDFLKNLTYLNLSSNGITIDGCKLISTSKILSNLTHLDLSENNELHDGLVEIVKSPNMKNIRSLIAFNCECTEITCFALYNSKYMTNLTCLDLSMNNINKSGCTYICNSSHTPNLINLSLQEINCNALKIISTSRLSEQLETIHVDTISDYDYILRIKNLKVLNLSYRFMCNDFTQNDAIYLFEQLGHLQSIDVGRDKAIFSKLPSGELLKKEIGQTKYQTCVIKRI